MPPRRTAWSRTPTPRCWRTAPHTFAELRAFLAGQDLEGLVFHHPDRRMGKIKLRDFGLKRGKPPG